MEDLKKYNIRKYRIPHHNSKEQIRKNFEALTGEFYDSGSVFVGEINGYSFSLKPVPRGRRTVDQVTKINITIADDYVDVEKMYYKAAENYFIIAGFGFFMGCLVAIGAGLVWPPILGILMFIGAIFQHGCEYDGIIKDAVTGEHFNPKTSGTPLKNSYFLNRTQPQKPSTSGSEQKADPFKPVKKVTIEHQNTKEQVIENFRKSLKKPYCPFIGEVQGDSFTLKIRRANPATLVNKINIKVTDDKVEAEKHFASLFVSHGQKVMVFCASLLMFAYDPSLQMFLCIPASLVICVLWFRKENACYEKDLKRIINGEFPM